MSKAKRDKSNRTSPDLDTPTDLPQGAVDKISASLNTLLADAFALYLKTKNFHWHVSGRHFRDYHLMLDEQSDAIFARNLFGAMPADAVSAVSAYISCLMDFATAVADDSPDLGWVTSR